MAANVPGRKRRTGQILFAVMLALCALLTFGVTADDEAALRGFDEAADGWQADPEFRAVAMDYCVRGARALHTRPLLLSADNVMMGLRSLPFLPKRFAVNPTSRAHYDNFGRGPLSAYLHLCGEQSVRDFADVLESLGKQPTRTPDDLRKFLDAFQMDYPVCKDNGALDSVARLLDDADAARPLAVRDDVGPLLAPHISALARELQIPDDVARMTSAQQLAVLQRLDDFVRRRDPELWRTKQLNDFCGGVWAQVFSPPYQTVIKPGLAMHRAAGMLLVAMLAWAALARTRRRAPELDAAAPREPEPPPSPAAGAPAAA